MAKKMAFLGVILIILAGIMMVMNGRSSQLQAGKARGLIAVSAQGDPLPDNGDGLPAGLARQSVNGMMVSLSIAPFPIVGGQQSDFEISLTDVSGQPVTDASVNLDLSMPSMPMPANQISAQPFGDGRYVGAGYFTMRGGWRIEVIIARAGQTQSVYFEVGL